MKNGGDKRARIWLDAASGQLWREELELTMHSAVAPDPLVVTRIEAQYGPGSLAVWLPLRMVCTAHSPVQLRAGRTPEMFLRARTTVEYRAFRRFAVTVGESSVAPPPSSLSR